MNNIRRASAVIATVLISVGFVTIASPAHAGADTSWGRGGGVSVSR